jgi:hypothetical protein
MYLLDEDDDGTADYHLNFGPPGYEPENNELQKPKEGDEITIMGGLFEPPMHENRPNPGQGNPPQEGNPPKDHPYKDLPIVIVFEINDQTWIDPESPPEFGFGPPPFGKPGHNRGRGHINFESLETVTLSGIVVEDTIFYRSHLFLDVDGDEKPDYVLDFGPPPYEPESGVQRPVEGDEIEVKGGLLETKRLPIVVVFELNGMVWFDPSEFQPGRSDGRANGQPFKLSKNYPNPFNPQTTIEFTLLETVPVKLQVYNVLGQNVATLANGTLTAGMHRINFNASALPSGLYFYELRVGNQSQIQKMHYMK